MATAEPYFRHSLRVNTDLCKGCTTCMRTCPTGAIVFGSKEAMKEHAEERITDLKSRGYDNAGLYDPPGVGGTHVVESVKDLLPFQFVSESLKK